MPGDLFFSLTLITNFLCMAVSFWFAIYLLARSSTNPLIFRAVVALLALAFYYSNAFNDLVNTGPDTGPVRSLATLIALVAGHGLTHYMLPLPQQKKLYWIERGVILLGGVATVLLFTAPSAGDCDPRFNCPSNTSYPWVVIDSFKVFFFAAILYNLWLIRKSELRLQNVAFYIALLLGASGIAYSLVGTVLNQPLPRYIPNSVMLIALALLLYSVVHDRALLTRRRSDYDLPITLLTITIVVGIYGFTAWQIGLDATGIVLLAVLAIFTHSAYDFVRLLIDRLFRAQEDRLRQELRQLGRDTDSEGALPRFLNRGLAILCHTLGASHGLILLRQQDRYQVIASLHSLPLGSQVPASEIPPEVSLGSEVSLTGHRLWLVPAFVNQTLVAIAGVGDRKDHIPYSEEDFYWLEDIVEEIGWMITTYWQTASDGVASIEPFPVVESLSLDPVAELDADELFSKLAYKPEPELVKSVEECLRNLNDYSILGRSSLVSMFSIKAQDHIECGKLVQQKLTAFIDKLRPAGDVPDEPLPREWYAYTILHDAYVENRLSREIMSKLYISEGTYYRMRRHALRGVTRAMLEMGVIA